MSNSKINTIEISGASLSQIASHPLKRERETALNDIIKDNFFEPKDDNSGPYDLKLSIEDGRLVIYMKNALGKSLNTLILSIKPYKRLIQDYFIMIQSYESARHEGNRERLEAIDMGRRGIHNEGAELFMERLKDKVAMDVKTARRLFTLICALNKNNLILSR